MFERKASKQRQEKRESDWLERCSRACGGVFGVFCDCLVCQHTLQPCPVLVALCLLPSPPSLPQLLAVKFVPRPLPKAAVPLMMAEVELQAQLGE